MRQIFTKALKIILFLSVGLILLYFAFRDISLTELSAGLKSANYYWVLLSLLFATLAFISRTYRWLLLIEPLGYKPSPANTFYALMTGYLANFALPRIGELARCGSLNKTERLPVDKLLGTVITERISDVVALLALLGYTFIAGSDFLGTFIRSYIVAPIYNKFISAFDSASYIYILTASLLILLMLVYMAFRVRLRKFSLFGKIESAGNSILAGMKTIMRMDRLLPYLLHTLFIWLMYYLMTWAVFMALPATAGLGGNAVLFILVIGGFGMAAPVQGGIGAYHWIVSVGLGLFDISRQEGLVFATLSHESQALLMILLGSFSLFMVFTTTKKRLT